MSQQGNHTAIVIPAGLKEPNKTKGWKRVFNTRTAIAVLLVVSAVFGAYVQQTNKMHESFYWERLLSLALNLIALVASIYIFYDDARRSNVAWRSPTLQRPWVCYYKIGEEITDIPYIGQPYNIMSILFGLCQSGLALGSFISLQAKGQHFALKFCLPTVVFSLVMLIASIFSNPRGASVIHPPSAQPAQQPLHGNHPMNVALLCVDGEQVKSCDEAEAREGESEASVSIEVLVDCRSLLDIVSQAAFFNLPVRHLASFNSLYKH